MSGHATSHASGHGFPPINIGGINSQVHLGDRYYTFDTNTATQPLEDRYKKELLKSLYFPEVDKRLNYLEERSTTTFEWIWEPRDRDKPPWDSFVDWLKGESKVYWILGKLGSGKSTLMKYIIDSLRDKDDNQLSQLRQQFLTLSFFFYQPGVELESSVLGCLRSLLWQLVRQITPNTVHQIAIAPGHHWSIPNLHKAFKCVLDAIGTPILVFLDGLDECRDTDLVLRTLSLLQGLQGVKLCVSSRPEQAYLHASSKVPKLRLQDLNEADIRLFIQHELVNNPNVQSLTSDSREASQKIIPTLQAKTQGVFLWVRLVVKSLLRGLRHRDTIADLLKRVDRLPEDIDELYSYSLQRLGGDEEMYAREAAVFYELAKRGGLTLLESCLINSPQLRHKYFDLSTYATTQQRRIERDIDGDLISTRINVCSAGLLEVVEHNYYFDAGLQRFSGLPVVQLGNKKVQFIHRSAYQFVFENPKCRQPPYESPVIEIETLKAIFEAILISEMVIPCVLRGCLSWRQIYQVLHRGRQFSKWSELSSWVDDLETVCRSLIDRGFKFTGSEGPSQILQSGSFDFAMICARAGYADVVRSKLHKDKGSLRESYLSSLFMQAALANDEQTSVVSGIPRDDIIEMCAEL